MGLLQSRFRDLGQIVEDVSGLPFGTYLRQRVFAPLGMDSSDLARSQRVRSRLATGYQLRGRGLVPVTDRENMPPAPGRCTPPPRTWPATSRHCWAAARTSAATCCGPGPWRRCSGRTTSPTPASPGWAWRSSAARPAGTDRGREGIWTGFHTAMLLVPGEGIGVVVFTNTGPFSPLAAALPVANAVLRSILRLGDDAAPAPVPQQPWTWRDLCGWYSFGPGVLTDPQPRMLGPAAEVAVRHGQLVLRGQFPVPAVRRGLALHPDGADPDTFRISMPGLGSATSPAVFSRGPGGKVTALHLAAQPLSLHKRPDARNPRQWAAATVAGGAVALAARHRRGACRAR